MRKIDPILKKLRELTNTTTDVDMCAALDLNYATLDGWKTQDKIPPRRLFAFAEKFNISVDALKSNVLDDFVVEDSLDGYWITKISHDASAGVLSDISGIEVYDTGEKIFLPKTFFKSMMDERKLRAIQVVGDSMLPKLHSGDCVIIDINNKFLGDGLYVINYNDILMVKMLQFLPNNNILVKSLNPDYSSYEVEANSQETLYIIGHVVKIIL